MVEFNFPQAPGLSSVRFLVTPTVSGMKWILL